ncbi:hypothetical protein GOBAR_DD35589 [Gossypium barbadense]|nr:hypothetical protein GOBAR_DD35589 [Gossypium barbadense]
MTLHRLVTSSAISSSRCIHTPEGTLISSIPLLALIQTPSISSSPFPVQSGSLTLSLSSCSSAYSGTPPTRVYFNNDFFPMHVYADLGRSPARKCLSCKG